MKREIYSSEREANEKAPNNRRRKSGVAFAIEKTSGRRIKGGKEGGGRVLFKGAESTGHRQEAATMKCTGSEGEIYGKTKVDEKRGLKKHLMGSILRERVEKSLARKDRGE